MELKIVLKVNLECEKRRSKAMETAAAAPGVTKVEIQGKEDDELVVVGRDVDAVCLTSGLKKKLRYANLVSVSEVKREEPKPKPKPEPKQKPPEPYCVCYYNISCNCHSSVFDFSYPRFW